MRRELVRLTAALCVGAILGGTMTFTAAGRSLREQRLANVELSAQLERLREEHTNLTARLAQLSQKATQQQLVREVNVAVAYPNAVYRLEIERQVRSLLAKLPGTPVNRLDYSLLYNLLEGRILQVKDRSVKLSVRVILGGQDLSIYLSASDQPS